MKNLFSCISSPGSDFVDVLAREAGGEKQIIIALIGQAGSGKTAFIGKVVGNDQQSAAHNLEPQTNIIIPVSYQIPGRSSKVILLDTPGWEPATKIKIAEWLRTSKNHVHLSGVIYLHRITDNCLVDAPKVNDILSFTQLCPARQISLVTTMWDTPSGRLHGNSNLDKLKSEYWKEMDDHGSQIVKYNNTQESARAHIESMVNGLCT